MIHELDRITIKEVSVIHIVECTCGMIFEGETRSYALHSLELHKMTKSLEGDDNGLV